MDGFLFHLHEGLTVKIGYSGIILFIVLLGSTMSIVPIKVQWEPSRQFVERLNEIAKNVKVKLDLKQIDEFFTPERAIRYGGIITLMLALPYGSRLAWNVLEKNVLNPDPSIINKQAHPKYGWWDRISRWWSSYETLPVIFDQSVKDHLIEIEKKTKSIRNSIRAGDKRAMYANLLLYGAPGTGKTMFARVLADYTDMDFLPTTAESLMRSSSAFDDLVAMANKSRYGAIIFIDEADALFYDRTRLLQSTAPDALAQYKTLNHILGFIDQRNNKFMVVAATNFPHVMDKAMHSRFPDKVEMPLPDLSTRQALLRLYSERELFDEKHNSKDFVESARLLLNQQKINEIAQQLVGFSPRDIQGLIQTVADTARHATKTKMITIEHIDNAVKRALEEHKKLEISNQLPA